MAEYDLTSKIGGYLDRHLIFPMLEFLSEKKVRLLNFNLGTKGWKAFSTYILDL